MCIRDSPYYDGYSISFGMTEGGEITSKQIIPTWDPNTNTYVDIPISKVLSGQGLQLQQARNNFWSLVGSMNEQNNR